MLLPEQLRVCARRKGAPLTEVLFYFALPYGACLLVEGTAMCRWRNREGQERRREEERKEAPWVDAARYPPNVTVERGAICPLTSV